jgi:hypothetical protein
MSLFKHTQQPYQSGTPLPQRLRNLGHTVSDTVLHPHMPATLKTLGHQVNQSVLHPKRTRCSVCFADLSPEDQPLGCCSDSAACGCRASSARCW